MREERKRWSHRLETVVMVGCEGGGRRWNISCRSSSQRIVSIWILLVLQNELLRSVIIKTQELPRSCLFKLICRLLKPN